MSDLKVSSPMWGANTKLVIAFTFVAIVSALVIRFSNILVPLLFTFMVSYLLHPLVSLLDRNTKLSWRAAVNLVYIVMLIVVIGFLVVLGVAIVQQLQELVVVISNVVNDLPSLARNISEEGLKIDIGIGTFDLTQLISQLNIDVLELSNQILEFLKPILGQAGSLLGVFAASTLGFLGWGAFIFIISYFILADANKFSNTIFNIDIPGVLEDVQRIGRELGRIWNAFLRGQLFLFITAVIGAFIVLAVAGVQNALGLAVLVGLAKFIPYVGPVVANIAIALVAYFQPSNYLNLEPIWLVIIVVAILMVMDQIFDYLIAPRLYGSVLGIHPAALLVTAIILASLIGLMGIILAAPVLASMMLLARYTTRKMLDLDPWPHPEVTEVDIDYPFEQPIRRLIKRVSNLRNKKTEKRK